ncbi:MAG: acyl-CoA dehydrogenase family protein, partial [SAR324 cluster bacterium]|nr:acyl-CoA dehydrogenase family protein [SAR324 cluster bacterium]
MDIKETSDLAAFRKSVRDRVQEDLPGGMDEPYNYRGREADEKVDIWYDKLAACNWLAFRWPKEFGGAGFSPPEQIVFLDELQNCGAPIPRGFGISMVGPLL